MGLWSKLRMGLLQYRVLFPVSDLMALAEGECSLNYWPARGDVGGLEAQ
jgi:hypothetical protein